MQPPSNMQGIPLVGQRQKQAEAAVQQAISQLSMQIYARVAVDYLSSHNLEVVPQHLQDAAKNSLEAAKAYFIALGAIREHNDAETQSE
jgi:hypothetical protein